MSLLPQQKKSADEIAKLRETLGIIPPPPVTEEPPAEIPVTAAAPEDKLAGRLPEVPTMPADAKRVSVPPTPHSIEEIHEVKELHLPERPRRIPVLSVEESGPPPNSDHLIEAAPLPAPAPAPVPIQAHHGPKVVRSLRKSEQVPLAPVPPPAPDSRLPVHRHNDQELNAIRRHDALATLAPWAHPHSLTAHWALLAPGYLFAIAGAVCFYFYDVERREMRITAGCAAIALMFAIYIYFKKPLSRHHAAFIGVMVLFVIVFGALYYFPQLRHGT